MHLLSKFLSHWHTQFPKLTAAQTQLLVAVSGGVDSVVLVDLLAAAGFSFVMAHCNFQLRGEESERDEQFVRSLAAKYEKELFVQKFDTRQFALESKLSIQEAARELRYTWFAELLKTLQQKIINQPQTPNPKSQQSEDLSNSGTPNRSEAKIPRIAGPQTTNQPQTTNHKLQTNHRPQTTNYKLTTAHHADDNIETLLMHFFRGTGIQGLVGIQPELVSRQLIRPLLKIRKEELLSYAAEKGLQFVEDSSNASDKYTRNYFRNQLIPQIKEVFPQVEENLLHNIDRMVEVQQLYQQAVKTQLERLLEKKGEEWQIPVLKWKKIEPLHTLTWEIIKPFGFHAAQTKEVIKLLDAENGSYQLSETHRIYRNRNRIILSPIETSLDVQTLVESGDTEIRFSQGKLLFRTLRSDDADLPADLREALLDRKDIQFPLFLRKWKTGDYFYPLGMQKKKKISKFLIDLKLSRTDKEKVWVLESNRKIIWVIGYRIDHRFRVTNQSKELLQVQWQ